MLKKSCSKEVINIDMNRNNNSYGSLDDIENLDDYRKFISLDKIQSPKHSNTLFLCLSSLGCIFGDISTSPLYTFDIVLAVHPTADDTLGAMSVLFYLFTVVVVCKYALVILYVGSYKNEGGQLAIFRKIININHSTAINLLVTILCFVSCSLIVSDGLLTPSTSILSAMTGLTVPFPEVHNYIVPVSIGILLTIFMIQRFGAHRLSFIFAPIVCTWLIVLGIIGGINIYKYPNVLFALNPKYAYNFIITHGLHSFNGFILAVTGTEALFLDLGYIGVLPIQLTLIVFVYPCLMMNYFGQAAYLIQNPNNNFYVFYKSIPGGPGTLFYWSVFALATMSTIIASQALILGIFTIVHQLSHLRMFPRLNTYQLDPKNKHTIYIPSVNYSLLAGLVLTILIFKDPITLSAAYGLAITIDFFVTSILIVLVLVLVYKSWYWLLFLVFIPLDMGMIYGNLSKFFDGGYFTIFISLGVFFGLVIYNRVRFL